MNSLVNILVVKIIFWLKEKVSKKIAFTKKNYYIGKINHISIYLFLKITLRIYSLNFHIKYIPVLVTLIMLYISFLTLIIFFFNSTIREPDQDGRGVRYGTHLLPKNTSKKKIYMQNDLHRTSTECWQKISGLQKGKKSSTKLGRTKGGKKEIEKKKRNHDGTSTTKKELRKRKGIHT